MPRIIPGDTYLGIDPGASGGLVLLGNAGIVITYTAMPETLRDLWDWLRVRVSSSTTAMVEWINPGIFGIRKSSMSKLYGNYMAIQMALTAAGVPFEMIDAKIWQNALKVKPRVKKENTSKWKGRLRAKAQQLYPRLDLWEQTKGKQLAVADALLIATCCYRTHNQRVSS